MTATLKERLDGAEVIELERPRPLRRPSEASEPYPIDELGPVIAAAVRGVVDVVQVPAAIAAHSALANAALAVQAHVGVELAHGEVNPASLFLLSVASSGDRKSAADKLLANALNVREAELQDDFTEEMAAYQNEKDAYDSARSAAKSAKVGKQTKSRSEISEALKMVGDEPIKPRAPLFTAVDPTVEGVHINFSIGQPILGIFSDEGGQFTGGFGMSKDNALKTSTALSSMWDGGTIKRLRAGEGLTVHRGKRVSMHLMMQPSAAAEWLGNETVKGQGLFGRFLIAAPDSLAGSRFNRAPQRESMAAVDEFNSVMLNLLRRPMPLKPTGDFELQPRLLRMSPDAKKMLHDYSDAVERERGETGKFAPISSFANKIVSHVARIAAVTAAFHDLDLMELRVPDIARGIRLAEWYLAETLRIFNAGHVSPEIGNAEKLLGWLQSSWPAQSATGDNGRLVSLVDCYQFGPNCIRDADAARAAMETLKRHGWVRSVEGRQKVNNQMRSEVFAVVPE